MIQEAAAPAYAPATPAPRYIPPPLPLLKPPLKWAGGKRWLVPHMRPIWEPFRHRRYVEPFCGGLALPLAFMPEHALLNDTNRHLISFYQWLQRGLDVEHRACATTRRSTTTTATRFNQHVRERRRRRSARPPRVLLPQPHLL